MLYLLVSQFDNLTDVFPEWRIWKICILGKLNRPLYKTKGKITASMKSEMGEGLLYQQLLSTLKTYILYLAFSKHALAIKKKNKNPTRRFLKTTIRSQSCIPVAWQCQGGEGLAGTPKAASVFDRIKRRSGLQHYRGSVVFWQERM